MSGFSYYFKLTKILSVTPFGYFRYYKKALIIFVGKSNTLVQELVFITLFVVIEAIFLIGTLQRSRPRDR
jgi:hypothetical protein